MSSRVTRTLLRLYPRRIRDRYGQELLDLDDELRAHGEVSRTRVIRDMITGALLIRPTRQRTGLIGGAVLVIAGLAVIATIAGGHGTDSPAHASHRQVRLIAQARVAQTVRSMPYSTCPVAAGSSCSLTPCTELIGQPSDQDAVAHGNVPTIQRRRNVTVTTCAAHRNAQPQNRVLVAQPATTTRPPG